MNVIDFIRESAKYICDSRPDVYDEESAIEQISNSIDMLREDDSEGYECIIFASFMLSRIYQDGDEEFILSESIYGLIMSDKEEGSMPYSFSAANDGLPFILDIDPDEEDDDEDCDHDH